MTAPSLRGASATKQSRNGTAAWIVSLRSQGRCGRGRALHPLDDRCSLPGFELWRGRCRRLELRQDLLHRRRDQEVDGQFGPDERELLHMVEEGAERVPEAGDVGDQD